MSAELGGDAVFMLSPLVNLRYVAIRFLSLIAACFNRLWHLRNAYLKRAPVLKRPRYLLPSTGQVAKLEVRHLATGGADVVSSTPVYIAVFVFNELAGIYSI